jgi:hypothetical protein
MVHWLSKYFYTVLGIKSHICLLNILACVLELQMIQNLVLGQSIRTQNLDKAERLSSMVESGIVYCE